MRLVATLAAASLVLSTMPANAIVFKMVSAPPGSSTACTDNDDGETDHPCVIKVFVIALNDQPPFVCQTFLDWEKFTTIPGNLKVKWKIKNAQHGDPHTYTFDLASGIAPVPASSTEPDDFLEKAVDDPSKRDKFHWILKDASHNTHTPKHYQINVTRDDGEKCKQQDPLIVNGNQ